MLIWINNNCIAIRIVIIVMAFGTGMRVIAELSSQNHKLGNCTKICGIISITLVVMATIRLPRRIGEGYERRIILHLLGG